MIITDKNVNELIDGGQPLLIDIYTESCGPCRRLKPIIKELEEEYNGSVKIGTLDGQKNYNTLAKYGIKSVPTLLFFNNGTLVDKLIGFQSKEDINKILVTLI